MRVHPGIVQHCMCADRAQQGMSRHGLAGAWKASSMHSGVGAPQLRYPGKVGLPGRYWLHVIGCQSPHRGLAGRSAARRSAPRPLRHRRRRRWCRLAGPRPGGWPTGEQGGRAGGSYCATCLPDASGRHPSYPPRSPSLAAGCRPCCWVSAPPAAPASWPGSCWRRAC